MTIKLKLSAKNIFIFGALFIFSFSVIAYATVPYEADDLSRYFYWIEAMKGNGLQFAFSESPFGTTVISNMLLYIVSIIGDEHFLPAIAVAIDGSCVLYIIINEKMRKNISTRIIISYIVICIGVVGLYESVSGIRFTMAASTAAVVIYNDYIKNKKGIITIWGYIILPFIHMATIPILFVRLLSELKISGKVKVLFLIFPPLIVLFQASLSAIPIQFIQQIMEKFNTYQGIITIGASFKRNIGYILFNLLFYITLILVKQRAATSENRIELGESKFINFMELYSLFSMGTYFIIQESFYRNTSIIAILALPVFVLFKRYRNKYAIIISLLYAASISIFYIYEYMDFLRNWKLV